jgi:hypothetical protein
MLFQLKLRLIRLRTFLKSLLWHISLGLPKTPRHIILQRYTICNSCSSYDSKNKQCLECGCNISDKSIFLNKLAWADQSCPLGKWKQLL